MHQIELSDLYEKINLLCMFVSHQNPLNTFYQGSPAPHFSFPTVSTGRLRASIPWGFHWHVPPPHFWTELDPRWNELNIFLNILAYQKSFLHDVRLKALHETFKNDQCNVAKRSDHSWQQYTYLVRTIQFGNCSQLLAVADCPGRI